VPLRPIWPACSARRRRIARQGDGGDGQVKSPAVMSSKTNPPVRDLRRGLRDIHETDRSPPYGGVILRSLPRSPAPTRATSPTSCYRRSPDGGRTQPVMPVLPPAERRPMSALLNYCGRDFATTGHGPA